MEERDVHILGLSAADRLELSAFAAKLDLKVIEYLGGAKGAPDIFRKQIESLEEFSAWERERSDDCS